ncbi:MAG: DUF58 domain-containing protein [Campylobacterota bacterium]|nr:DUF58 domain-containing protein [Campylobacterota bacterium]
MKAKLKTLLIKTKKSVFGHQIGNNSSKFKGDGYDFVELREYEDGEDIRKIDWVISAKLQTPYVKVFHTQRQLNISIVPILNGSVHFGTSRLKQEVITEICAALGYGAVANGDNFESFIANDGVELVTKKSKSLYHIDKMCQQIYSYDAVSKKESYSIISSELFKSIKSKSIIFLIGDFFNVSDLNLNLLSKKHEVVALIVRDYFEEHPKALGNVNFTDPVSGKVFEGNLNSTLVSSYEKKVKQNDMELYNKLNKSGVEFTKIYTNDNVTAKLMKLFGG